MNRNKEAIGNEKMHQPIREDQKTTTNWKVKSNRRKSKGNTKNNKEQTKREHREYPWKRDELGAKYRNTLTIIGRKRSDNNRSRK